MVVSKAKGVLRACTLRLMSSLGAYLLVVLFLGGGVIHGRPGLDVVGARDFRSRGAIHIHVPAQAQQNIVNSST